MTIISYRDKHPSLDRSVRIAEGSCIVGDVSVAAESSLWYNAVVRGDVHWVRIGRRSNIQDGAVLHVTRETNPLTVGSCVTVGHGAILHGCIVEDLSLIGMGATVLDGAVVQSFSFVAAGAIVSPGTIVTSGTLVAGVPAKPLRKLRQEEREHMQTSADRYYSLACELLSEASSI